MLKNNKGITLVALVLTIIVVMILASITYYSGAETIVHAKYYNAISQMKLMQAKVNEIYEEYTNGDETTKNKILEYGKTILESGKSIDAKTAYNSVQTTNPEEVGDIGDYRYYDTDYIKNTLDMEGIDFDFIINIKNRTVILIDGTKNDGIMYYSLCQIPDEQYNVKYEPD